MSLWDSFKSTLRRWFLGQSAAEGGVKLQETPKPEASTPKEEPKTQKAAVDAEIVMPRQPQPSAGTSSESALDFANSLVKTLGQVMKTGLELAKKDDKKEEQKALPEASTEREPD